MYESLIAEDEEAFNASMRSQHHYESDNDENDENVQENQPKQPTDDLNKENSVINESVSKSPTPNMPTNYPMTPGTLAINLQALTIHSPENQINEEFLASPVANKSASELPTENQAALKLNLTPEVFCVPESPYQPPVENKNRFAPNVAALEPFQNQTMESDSAYTSAVIESPERQNEEAQNEVPKNPSLFACFVAVFRALCGYK